MLQTDLSFTLSVLVPIMFILVIEIATKARSLELYELLPNNEPRPRTGWEASVDSLLTRILPKLEPDQHIPRFGHFGSLHGVSQVILYYGAGLIGYGLEGDARLILWVAIFVMMGVLPLIEIDEYRHIDTYSTFPTSAKYHAIGHLLQLAFASFLGQALARGVSLPVIILLAFAAVLVPSAVATIYFSVRLESELRENQPSSYVFSIKN